MLHLVPFSMVISIPSNLSILTFRWDFRTHFWQQEKSNCALKTAMTNGEGCCIVLQLQMEAKIRFSCRHAILKQHFKPSIDCFKLQISTFWVKDDFTQKQSTFRIKAFHSQKHFGTLWYDSDRPQILYIFIIRCYYNGL